MRIGSQATLKYIFYMGLTIMWNTRLPLMAARLAAAMSIILFVGTVSQSLGQQTSRRQASGRAVPRMGPIDTIPLGGSVDGEKPSVVSGLALDHNGDLLVAIADDHHVWIFDARQAKLLHRTKAHSDWGRAVTFHPTGQVLATAGNDRCICLVEASSGRLSHQFAKLPQAIHALAYSPDGKSLVAGGFADKIWILDASTGQIQQTLEAPAEDVRALAFSPDGLRLAVTGRSKTIRVFDWSDPRKFVDLQGSDHCQCSLAFSPDSMLLAAGGHRRSVRIWNLAESDSYVDLPQRPAKVMSLTFCGQERLAVGGTDNVIRLWDLTTNKEEALLEGHTGSVTALVFHEGSNELISGSFDTTWRRWRLDSVPEDTDQVSRR